MKVLAIDFGLKRVGIALSDDLGMFGSPLTTIEYKNRQQLIADVANLAREHKVDKILLGLPLGIEGKPTKMSELIEKFARLIEEQHNYQVVRWNESYSSQQAAKLSKHIDSKSAQLILQEYLNYLHDKV